MLADYVPYEFGFKKVARKHGAQAQLFLFTEVFTEVFTDVFTEVFTQVFSACDFIAPIFITITQHIPNKRFQMVRYYCWYSFKMRGQRRKRAEEAQEEAARDFTARAEMPHLIHSIRTSVQTVV